jgi:hypothetical protein
MLCLVKNSKGTGALLCCSIGEPNCFASEHPTMGHKTVISGFWEEITGLLHGHL